MQSRLGFLLLFVICLPQFVLSHTTKICSVPNSASVTFYACSYHSTSESPTVNGGIYIDGIRHAFTQVVPYTSMTIPSTATCVDCGDGMTLNRCQTMTIAGLANGFHTISTSCDSIYECSYCTFQNLYVNTNTDPCLSDSDAPRMTCSSSVTVSVNNTCVAGMPNVTQSVFACDRCSDVQLTQSISEGTLLSPGSYNVTVTGTDGSGNSASCQVTVYVVDNTPPSLILSASPSVLWPPNHKMIDITITASFNDNCVFNPIGYNLTNVVVDNGDTNSTTGSGNTAVDWNIVNRTRVQLRAERSGSSNGRNYYIVGTGSDSSNNTIVATTLVVVPHD